MNDTKINDLVRNKAKYANKINWLLVGFNLVSRKISTWT